MSIKKVEHDFLTRLFQFLGRSEIIIHQVKKINSKKIEKKTYKYF